jgi:hypothetical protein
MNHFHPHAIFVLYSNLYKLNHMFLQLGIEVLVLRNDRELDLV